MSDARTQLPSYWVHDSDLVPLLFEAFSEGSEGITWLQAVAEVAYLLAAVLASNVDSTDVRRDVGATLGEMLRQVGLTGNIERGPLQ